MTERSMQIAAVTNEYEEERVEATRVAVVTGGANGIGWATCAELNRLGWKVVVADADLEKAKERAGSNPAALYPIALDVRDQSSVEECFTEAVAQWGQLDLLVNSAGIQLHTSIADLDWAAWHAVIDVNLHGTLRCMVAAAPHMFQRGAGVMVNISSVAGERGAAGRAPYSVSKAGVVALTRTAAVEWALRGIRVNAVAPGYVETDMLREFQANGALDPTGIIDHTPMRRFASPQEIASVICFLASDAASFITGQVIPVDGGFLVDYGIPSSHAPLSA